MPGAAGGTGSGFVSAPKQQAHALRLATFLLRFIFLAGLSEDAGAGLDSGTDWGSGAGCTLGRDTGACGSVPRPMT